MCGTDVKLYKTPPTKAPVIMGHENIGVIAKAGREFTRRKGFKEGDLVFVEHYVMCGKCEWCLAGQYRHCENTDWRTNPEGIRYGYTSAERAPHLWGGFAQYVYLPWNAVIHRVPQGVSPEPRASSRRWRTALEWSAFRRRRGLRLDRAHPGAGAAGPLADRDLQAGRRLPHHRHRHFQRFRRLSVAKALGADHVIDVNKEDPLARIKEITGGKGVDVVLDCTAGAGTIDPPRRRSASSARAALSSCRASSRIPQLPARARDHQGDHHQERARPQLQGLRARPRATRLQTLPPREGHDAPLPAEGRRPRHQVGRRTGRPRRDPRLAHALALGWPPTSSILRRSS